MAGFSVDLAMFPVDTIKTRLQSELGFRKSGGFRRIYAGLPSVVVGSAPGSALFFTTYEFGKALCSNLPSTLGYMIAASMGETAACLIRVPTEVVKQRAQAFPGIRLGAIVSRIYSRGGLAGLYRGYHATMCREIPFSCVQFPLWEALKLRIAKYRGRSSNPLEGACCGCVAGVVAGAITTPLDVAKTRIMLSEATTTQKVSEVLRNVRISGGVRSLFAGLLPRTVWIGFGGFVFFGSFEVMKALLLYLTVPQGGARKQEGSPRDGSVVPPMYAWSTSKLDTIDRWLAREFLKKDRPMTFDEARQQAIELGEKLQREKELEEKRFYDKYGFSLKPNQTV